MLGCGVKKEAEDANYCNFTRGDIYGVGIRIIHKI
jgi:hypothetical protein